MKRLELLQRKKEKEELYEQDMKEAQSSKPVSAPASKVTRNMIEQSCLRKKAEGMSNICHNVFLEPGCSSQMMIIFVWNVIPR